MINWNLLTECGDSARSNLERKVGVDLTLNEILKACPTQVTEKLADMMEDAAYEMTLTMTMTTRSINSLCTKRLLAPMARVLGPWPLVGEGDLLNANR